MMVDPAEPAAPPLKGRHVIVTGGASGIGRAAAALIVRQGARVTLVDRDEAALARVAEDVGADPLHADLADFATVPQIVERAAEMMGGLDGIVNCAGISARATVPDLDLARWNQVLAVNLTAPYLICRAALPFLRQSPAASIVNVASAVGLVPIKGSDAAYIASKAGLIGLTRALASEFAPDVRVNAVCPGLTDTPMMAGAMADQDENGVPRSAGRYLLSRAAVPHEVAEGICFLLGGGSSFITGISMAIDGGRTFH